MKKLIVFAIAILGFTAVSFGQLNNTATATASGTIVSPLTIENKGDMAFGKVYSNTSAVDLVLSTSGTRSGTAGYDAASTAAQAKFDVVGTTSTAFTITLPLGSVSTTTMPNGATAMTVDSWTSNPAVGAGNTGVSGTQRVNIGATLHLNASQTPGGYVTAPFTVTVNYN